MPVNKQRLLKGVEALESGQYAQTKGKLCRVSGDDENRQEAYCCLGVLCEVAIKDGLNLTVAYDGDTKVYNNDESVLPYVVQQYYGLELDNPALDFGGKEALETGELDYYLARQYGSSTRGKQEMGKLIDDAPKFKMSAATLNDQADWNFAQIAKAFRRTYQLDESTHDLSETDNPETE
jgi:hypothetical protein